MRLRLPARWLCSPALMLLLATSAQAASLATPFTVRSLDGRALRLSDYKGRAVVVDFWATWCAPCRQSMPQLDRLNERYRTRGLVVIGLSVDDVTPQSVKRFADKLGVRFPLAMANEAVLDDYGPIRALPTTFYINRKGEIVRRVVGYLDADTMEEFVREIMGPFSEGPVAGPPPPPAPKH